MGTDKWGVGSCTVLLSDSPEVLLLGRDILLGAERILTNGAIENMRQFFKLPSNADIAKIRGRDRRGGYGLGPRGHRSVYARCLE